MSKCSCEWMQTNPGINDYSCEYCGIYTASGPMCNKCEDITDICYETMIGGLRRVVTKRLGNQWETYLLAYDGDIIVGPIVGDSERKAQHDHSNVLSNVAHKAAINLTPKPQPKEHTMSDTTKQQQQNDATEIGLADVDGTTWLLCRFDSEDPHQNMPDGRPDIYRGVQFMCRRREGETSLDLARRMIKRVPLFRFRRPVESSIQIFRRADA